MMKRLSILLSLQGVVSFQPIQRSCHRRSHRRSSIYQSTPSIEAPRWNVATFGRDIFPGILDHQTTRMELQHGAVSTRKDTKKNKFKFKSPEILNDLRSKSIKELKLQCSRRSVRYSGLEEHEDFVQAIVNDMNDLQDFSVSGLLYPRSVTEISSDILEEELGSDIPMLLDVYANFCGPCKIVEPEFEAAARKLGKNCRVAKLDSQKYPEVASRFKVQGLPTTLLIHKGAVVSRREGTVTRHQLLDFADPFVPKQYW